MGNLQTHPVMIPTDLMMYQRSRDYLARKNANTTAGNFHQRCPAQREGVLGAGIVQENQDEDTFREGNFMAFGPKIPSNSSSCASVSDMLTEE